MWNPTGVIISLRESVVGAIKVVLMAASLKLKSRKETVSLLSLRETSNDIPMAER